MRIVQRLIACILLPGLLIDPVAAQITYSPCLESRRSIPASSPFGLQALSGRDTQAINEIATQDPAAGIRHTAGSLLLDQAKFRPPKIPQSPLQKEVEAQRRIIKEILNLLRVSQAVVLP